MTSDCHTAASEPSCHASAHGKADKLLWGSAAIILLAYVIHWLFASAVSDFGWVAALTQSVFELVNTMWWGVTIGIFMVALLTKIPREFVMSILGNGGGISGIVRATLAGLLLDLCSHGILMVGAKLYERGATAGQTIAFLVASPWNSFSLTLVLIALVGFKWTLAFILFSFLIAIVSGVLFDWFVARGTLPRNQNTADLDPNFAFWPEAKKALGTAKFDANFFSSLAVNGFRDSRPVLRWILFGIVLAALVRSTIDTESFQTYFGPTLVGLGMTVAVATIIEVCSEGSTPIAADLLTRAEAPGNAFAFLMTGVATDYTEIMVLKETAKSLKFALFLPLVSLPQVLLIAWLLNAVPAG